MTSHHYEISPIGHVQSAFKEKFGLPRQPGLIKSTSAQILLQPEYSSPEALRELNSYSHIWLTFLFDQAMKQGWKACVRPPRLGGNKKVGVFASRSPFRPNHLGLSLVELLDIDPRPNGSLLIISCPDLVHGTPVVDIKPYVEYSDRPENARSGYAQEAPRPQLRVSFTNEVKLALQEAHIKYPDLAALIEECVSYDPRPAYKRQKDNKIYTLRLYEYDVVFEVKDDKATIIDLRRL